MRLVTTNTLQAGVILGKPVYNENGQVLISNGVPLTDRMIRRLLEMDITYVYIDDPKTKDIESPKTISEKTRKEAIQAIEETFHVMHNEKELNKAFAFNKIGKKFTSLIRNILRDVKSNKDVITLLSDVYSYDNYIFSHSLNVTIYTLALGLELKLNDKQLEEIGIGAILHDVGKMIVPLEILTKPGRLNDQEFDAIKMHAEDGFKILRKIPNIPLVAAHCAYQHHERLDGSGYPRGLVGNDIHYYSRILAVTDVFDAVTSNRVYRSAMLPHEGLEILYSGAGRQYEQEIIEGFRRAIAIYPAGLTVYLSDRRKGVVVRQNPGLSDRPVIRIIEDNDKEVEQPYEVDLSKELSVVITETDTTLMGKS